MRAVATLARCLQRASTRSDRFLGDVGNRRIERGFRACVIRLDRTGSLLGVHDDVGQRRFVEATCSARSADSGICLQGLLDRIVELADGGAFALDVEMPRRRRRTRSCAPPPASQRSPFTMAQWWRNRGASATPRLAHSRVLRNLRGLAAPVRRRAEAGRTAINSGGAK